MKTSHSNQACVTSKMQWKIFSTSRSAPCRTKYCEISKRNAFSLAIRSESQKYLALLHRDLHRGNFATKMRLFLTNETTKAEVLHQASCCLSDQHHLKNHLNSIWARAIGQVQRRVPKRNKRHPDPKTVGTCCHAAAKAGWAERHRHLTVLRWRAPLKELVGCEDRLLMVFPSKRAFAYYKKKSKKLWKTPKPDHPWGRHHLPRLTSAYQCCIRRTPWGAYNSYFLDFLERGASFASNISSSGWNTSSGSSLEAL